MECNGGLILEDIYACKLLRNSNIIKKDYIKSVRQGLNYFKHKSFGLRKEKIQAPFGQPIFKKLF